MKTKWYAWTTAHSRQVSLGRETNYHDNSTGKVADNQVLVGNCASRAT